MSREAGAHGNTMWEAISRMLSGSERSNSSGFSESLISVATPTRPEQPVNRDEQPTESGEGHRNTWIGSESVHETDWWSERDLIFNLQAFLPHLPPKAEDWEIEEGAVEYIKSLRDAIQKLEMENKETSTRTPASNQSLEIPRQVQTPSAAVLPVFKTWASPNVIVNIAGRDAHINICTLKRTGLLPAIADILEKRNLKMVSLHVSSGALTTILMIHAQTRMVEEAFKSAAKEINQWIAQHDATASTSI
ncbi:unnamed protein product [Spirodela intermedia]|uniref:Uncharacterized protein n=1 Tax=Spirodela intermedia TaxID=51605 RepID=A0A7I8JE35_SPIIN|nr:unnamed protein product [Spirodela intermedia]CAA6668377.1 unnamed protein product [Spirodela intermedia]